MMQRRVDTYFNEIRFLCDLLNKDDVEAVLEGLRTLKKGGGRLFILGVGGSAANAGHAVNDFRKISGIEAYAPTDNVAELTARTNDEGWDTTFNEWLKVSRLNENDALLVLSVGGGSMQTSPNIFRALITANDIGAKIYGIVGRNGGITKKMATKCIMIPTINKDSITPYVESFQAIIWHYLANNV